jgi:phosphatidylglycerol---prolipoprotein diacylglyceryl transferase
MFDPVLLTIYAPLAIHAYGLCIAVGVGLAVFLMLCDTKLLKIICKEQLIFTMQLMIFSGYFGGRLLFLFSEAQSWSDYLMLFAFWQPGLSILGCVAGVIFSMVCYLAWHKISILFYLDRVAICAPLAQSFGRLGCFFAGCCYGIEGSGWWSVTYTCQNHSAPLYVALHPVQLYSSICLMAIFLLFFFVLKPRVKTTGVFVGLYLILIGLERFLIDFIRSDRLFLAHSYFSIFSFHQWIALGLVSSGFVLILWLKMQSKKVYGSV